MDAKHSATPASTFTDYANDTPASPASFKPLDDRDIGALSEATRHAISWDLAASGQFERLRALGSMVPLCQGTTGHERVPLALAARLLDGADEAWLTQLLAEISKTLRCPTAKLDKTRCDQTDFGYLLAVWAYRAITHFMNGDEAAGTRELRRSLMLARTHELPLSGSWNDSYRYSYCPNLAYGFMASRHDDVVRPADHIQALDLDPSRPDAMSAALILARQGHAELLAALCERPESRRQLLVQCFEESAQIDRSHLFFKLGHPNFWLKAPEVGIHLLDLAVSSKGSHAPLLDRVLRAMVEAADHDASHPLLSRVMVHHGDNFLAAMVHGSTRAISALTTGTELYRQDPQTFSSALSKALDKVFSNHGAVPSIDNHTRLACLRDTIFSPVPGVAELAEKAWHKAKPDSGDPYVVALASVNIERHIESICHCERPDIVRRGLDAIGPERAQSFPGHRQGLDSSLLMWLAQKAPVHIFETALDWFDAHGALRAQADLKAWVYQGADTRKKGDLLAACVVEGRVDMAEALLTRIPDADTRSAREVAKALASKVKGDGAGQAMSAWESLLFKKILAQSPGSDAPAPASERRAPRL